MEIADLNEAHDVDGLDSALKEVIIDIKIHEEESEKRPEKSVDKQPEDFIESVLHCTSVHTILGALPRLKSPAEFRFYVRNGCG